MYRSKLEEGKDKMTPEKVAEAYNANVHMATNSEPVTATYVRDAISIKERALVSPAIVASIMELLVAASGADENWPLLGSPPAPSPIPRPPGPGGRRVGRSPGGIG